MLGVFGGTDVFDSVVFTACHRRQLIFNVL